VNGYRSHILHEDTALLLMARRLLGGEALARLSHAMRERRGI